MIPGSAVAAALEAFYANCDVDFDGLYAVRAALEAAAPYMLAEVWDQAIEAHKAWTRDDENMDPLTNPYRKAAQ